jgi:hypothetical protein
LETSTDLSPDRLFDRQWAEELLAAVRVRMEQEFGSAEKRPLLEVLDHLGEPDAPPLTQTGDPVGHALEYAEISSPARANASC